MTDTYANEQLEQIVSGIKEVQTGTTVGVVDAGCSVILAASTRLLQAPDIPYFASFSSSDWTSGLQNIQMSGRDCLSGNTQNEASEASAAYSAMAVATATDSSDPAIAQFFDGGLNLPG